MSVELQKFYQSNENIMLIAFGTLYKPGVHQFRVILEFMITVV